MYILREGPNHEMHDLRKTNVGRHGPHHLPLFSRPCNKNFKFYTKQPP